MVSPEFTLFILTKKDITYVRILETYLSGLGLGAVLFQKKIDGKIAPIVYASQIL